MKLKVVFLLGLLTVSLHAQSTEEVKAKILALENAWNLAEAHKDAKAMEQLMARELVFVDYDGTVLNKAQVLAGVRTSTSQQPKMEMESITARVSGKTVLVTGVYKDSGRLHGKAYSRKGRFMDVWVEQENGNWRCVASQATLMSKGTT